MWVYGRVQESVQVVFCAHRSIIRVSVVNVLVPVFRDKDTPHAGSYFSIYCTVPASTCATLIASSRVLRIHTDRSGIVATSSHNPTTKSQHLDSCIFNLLLPTTCFGHSFDHHHVEKMQILKWKMLHKSSCVMTVWSGPLVNPRSIWVLEGVFEIYI